MNKQFCKRILSGIASLIVCASALPSVLSASAYQELGQKDGYDWEMWEEYGQGTYKMDVGDAGTYSCEWSGIHNILFRSGRKWNDNPDWKSLNGITVDYEADYRPNGNSYLCIYGWMTKPTVEYYICDNYGTWRPPGNGFTLKGTKVIDGGTYEIYEGTHTGPSIFASSETFNQYWSIRVAGDLRSKGRITVSDHFKAWEECGIKLGGLHEVALNVEGWQSSGSAKITKNTITLGENVGEPDTTPPAPTEPVEPDENGYFFSSDFESGTDNWYGRGDAKTDSDSGVLSVKGRTDSWNGAAIDLDSNAFISGNSYGFTVDAKQNSEASADFKLTLQCDVSGETQYLKVASGTASKGEWITLSNPSFKIPAGASKPVLYVEVENSNCDFVIDNAVGAVENKIPVSTENPTAPTKESSFRINGDLNRDGRVDVYDIVLERQEIVKLFGGTAYNEYADIDCDGSVGMNDLVLLSEFILGKISKLPSPVQNPVTTNATTTKADMCTTTPAPSGNLMDAVKASLVLSAPANVQSGDQGTTKKITYMSKKAGHQKTANVWLPPGYSESQKYPVMYMNHGIFGDESSMLNGFAVREMASNLIKSGEAEPFIIVFPQMYTAPNANSPAGFGFDQQTMDYYDDFLYDLTESLMPYMEQNYSVKTGKKNTAIAGFSMGGRESLYIGVVKPDTFGYVCASSPAPGIVPAVDMFMTHRGSMSESEFRISPSDMPYLIMIGGGTNDGTVGTFPKQYHELFTKNNTDHVWMEIQGGGHDGSVGIPLFYNFFKYVFK